MDVQDKCRQVWIHLHLARLEKKHFNVFQFVSKPVDNQVMERFHHFSLPKCKTKITSKENLLCAFCVLTFSGSKLIYDASYILLFPVASLWRSKRTELISGKKSAAPNLMLPRASMFWAATGPLHPQDGKAPSICFFSRSFQEHIPFCSSRICRPLFCLAHGAFLSGSCMVTRLLV